MSPPRAPARPEAREVDLDWRSVVAVLTAFVGLVALTGLVRSAPRTIAALVVGGLIALALSPAVRLVDRRLGGGHRPLAVGIVLGAIAVVFVVGALAIAPPAVRQAQKLHEQVPSVVADLRALPVIGDDLERADVPARVQREIEDLPRRLAGDATPIQRAVRSLFDGLVAAVVTLLLATTLLLDGPRLGGRVRALVPADRRDAVDRAAELAYDIVGRYVAGSLFVSAVAGVVVLVTGLVLGIPLTPLVAAWVALWDLVPQIGGAVGALPFVVLGFTAGTTEGLICIVVFVLYQQVKHQLVGPTLIGHAVRLSPPATMMAALIGISAAGVVGALVAVPVTGAAKAIYLELRKEPVAAA